MACTPKTEDMLDPDALAANERRRVLEACDVLASDRHFALSDGGSGRAWTSTTPRGRRWCELYVATRGAARR